MLGRFGDVDGDTRLFGSGLKLGKWTEDSFLSPVPNRFAGELKNDLFRGFKTIHRYTSGELVGVNRIVSAHENPVTSFQGVDGPPNLGNPIQVNSQSGYMLVWDTVAGRQSQSGPYTNEYMWVYEVEYSGEFTRPVAILPFKERYDSLISSSGYSASDIDYNIPKINRYIGQGLSIAGAEIPSGLFEAVDHPRGADLGSKQYVNSWVAPNVILDNTLTIDFFKMFYDFSDGREFYHPIGLHGTVSESGFPFGGKLLANNNVLTRTDKIFGITTSTSGNWDFFTDYIHTTEEHPDYQSYSPVIMDRYFASGFSGGTQINNSGGIRTIVKTGAFNDAFTTKINLSGTMYFI
jgi:hypothetical protein